MNLIEFFTTDNKSGWKTKESTLRNNKPELYTQVKSFITENNLDELPFKQQIWHFIHGIKTLKTCINCGNLVSFRGTLMKGYHEFCSLSCANTSGLLQDRVTKSIKEKFGVDYFSQHETFINEVKETKLSRYKDENYNNPKKALETKEKLYGDKFYSNNTKRSLTVRANLIPKLDAKTSDKVLEYEISDKDIKLSCSTCNNSYGIYHNLFNYRTKVNVKPCVICNPIQDTNSIQEKELFEYVKGLLPNTDVFNKDRSLISNIKPIELDIHIPSYKLAIEFNGLYWHSDKFVNDTDSVNKTLRCLEKDTQLIHIFEDEWINKKEIVKSIISSKLNLSENKIYARKCEIKELSSNESRNFLNTNHIQGSLNSKIKLGLFYENELVAVMTFGSLRRVLGSKSKEGSYELLRYANKLNTLVIGGFSKLLKYFIKTHVPKEIITYSDNRYFTGGVYENAGFDFVSETRPNYFYIVNHKREHRFKYRKDLLVSQGFDINKTERQIMQERGIHRIYDCGTKKWILRL